MSTPEADVVATLAAPMPLRMITHIMGVPPGHERSFRHWSNNTVHVANIDISRRGLMQLVPTLSGFRQSHAYFTDQLSAGGMLGADTVLGRLVEHAEDGQVSHEELFFFAVLLLLAGNETHHKSADTCPHTGRTPGSAYVAARSAGVDRIGDRGAAPLPVTDPELLLHRPHRLPGRRRDDSGPLAGPLLWGAANRDPREYDDPDTFRADRNPNGPPRVRVGNPPAPRCAACPDGGAGGAAGSGGESRPDRRDRHAGVVDESEFAWAEAA